MPLLPDLPLRPRVPLRPNLSLHRRMFHNQLTGKPGEDHSPPVFSTTQTALDAILEDRQQFLGFVRRRVSDPALAEDILQAAYMRALQQGELAQGESVVAWFYRVLRNAVIDSYRRRSSEHKALQTWGREMETAVIPSHETYHEVCACLTRVVDALKPGYAEVLRAVDLGEQPLKDFARERNLSPSNAGVRVHRARAALRKQLIKTCGSCAEHACIECTCRR